MEPTDLTIEILREIRDEIKQTRVDLSSRIDQTNERIDQTNARLEQTRTDLSERIDETNRRLTDMELRVATELTEVAGAIQELSDMFRAQLDLRDKVSDHETRIAVLERTVSTD